MTKPVVAAQVYSYMVNVPSTVPSAVVYDYSRLANACVEPFLVNLPIQENTAALPLLQGRRGSDEPVVPPRRNRWDEARDRPADSWRVPPSPQNNSVDRWRSGDERERGPPRGGAVRWAEEERHPPRAWHEDGARAPRDEWRGPPGFERRGEAPRDGWRGEGGDREWGRREAPGGGSGWAPGGDPAWMHDESGAGPAAKPGGERGPGGGGAGGGAAPSRTPMTAKDMEAERQQYQAAWRAKQAEQGRQVGVGVRMLDAVGYSSGSAHLRRCFVGCAISLKLWTVVPSIRYIW
jgi:hypothetical protein